MARKIRSRQNAPAQRDSLCGSPSAAPPPLPNSLPLPTVVPYGIRSRTVKADNPTMAKKVGIWTIPTELNLQIIGYLYRGDAMSLGQTCTAFRALTVVRVLGCMTIDFGHPSQLPSLAAPGNLTAQDAARFTKRIQLFGNASTRSQVGQYSSLLGAALMQLQEVQEVCLKGAFVGKLSWAVLRGWTKLTRVEFVYTRHNNFLVELPEGIFSGLLGFSFRCERPTLKPMEIKHYLEGLNRALGDAPQLKDLSIDLGQNDEIPRMLSVFTDQMELNKLAIRGWKRSAHGLHVSWHHFRCLSELHLEVWAGSTDNLWGTLQVHRIWIPKIKCDVTMLDAPDLVEYLQASTNLTSLEIRKWTSIGWHTDPATESLANDWVGVLWKHRDTLSVLGFRGADREWAYNDELAALVLSCRKLKEFSISVKHGGMTKLMKDVSTLPYFEKLGLNNTTFALHPPSTVDMSSNDLANNTYRALHRFEVPQESKFWAVVFAAQGGTEEFRRVGRKFVRGGVDRWGLWVPVSDPHDTVDRYGEVH
ncbi:hypothetical protein FN846DRAFT_45880 [Sphaerosporella brunnea]|uniref:F-box domain-containing protein n=1 Tax=Sphaerosporella brunnea TaxID=1250544 RepID=A0A5J5EUE5_9PEZI|nr:hypothetical protein FN846DRAFT_45880 [Sphaerosporella brunnea]